MIRILLVLLLITPLIVSQDESINVEEQIIAADSVISSELNQEALNQEMLQSYQDILEKTNQQLSLWWNPYGLMIAALGVLFTILTIIAATIIFLQGVSAKKLLNDTITRHSEILNEYIEQKDKDLKILVESYSKELDELKKQAIESDNSGDFLKKINEFEKKLNALSDLPPKNWAILK